METKKLFKICFSLLLVLFFAVSVYAQPKVIKIGAIYPLTGNLATTGLDCKRGVEMAVDIINGKY
ncbi:MAG: amino acid ABC transporter substrate-binding protein, partial [Thermodesulfobacteriota bacterium]